MDKKLVLDKLSGHSKKAVVGRVLIKVGDKITKGQDLLSLEAGKGAQNFKSQYTGIVKDILIQEGQEILLGDNVILIDWDGESVESKEISNTPKKSYSFGITSPKKEEVVCDLLVIGGGPGGYVAAIRGVQLGMKTLLIEKSKLGGTCLNHGCIPTKTLSEGAKTINKIKESDVFGISVTGLDYSLEGLIDRKDEVVNTLVSGIDHLMMSNSIRVLQGEAVAIDKETIKVKTNKIDITIKPKKMILANGSSPFMLPIEGCNNKNVITSKEILKDKDLPKELTIIGGGVIGMEFAFIYNSLGSKVTVVEYANSILPSLDQDVSDVILESAKEKGINIITSACVERIFEDANDKIIAEFKIGDKKNYVVGDKVLMSVGRKANIDSIDLAKLDVALNSKGNGIEVDDYMRTSNQNIYAIGDVTNKMQLAHVASRQGMIAVDHMHGINNVLDYNAVPSGIFTTPEIGTVGITERIAKENGIVYKVAKFPMAASGKALAMNKTKGFVKLISSEGIIIGGTIVGENGTDMISTITNLIVQKTDINEAIKVIYPHPTLSEGIHESLLMLNDRGLHFG